jgi:general secretion pathway protein A
MVARYLAHFGLKAPPFSKEIADNDLWLPPSKKELLEELTEALQDRASVLLTGEPGVGKTCVLRALRQRLPHGAFRMTYYHNATLGRRDFYRLLCLALGLSPHATAAALFFAVSTHVEDLGREKLHPVLLVDEAHLLYQDTLDHLHILLNYQWDSRALLSMVLIGLPELADRMALRRNRSLYSRIHCRLTIDPITPEDTADYIAYRLKMEQCTREIFTSDAIALTYEAAVGSLREIDRIATAALRLSARRNRKLVERDVIEYVTRSAED